MSLIPRTLFGRNLLLLVGLIITSQLVSTVIVRQLLVKPRIEQLAGFSASNLEAIRAALDSLPAADRERYIERMNVGGGLHIERARDAVSGFAQPTLPAQRLFLRRLTEMLPDDRTDVEWKTEPENTLWVRLYVGDDSYWVTAAAGPIDLGLPRAWVWVTLASTLLAAIGAYLIQRRLDRPIRELVAAAGQIGDGSHPAALAETGPREIAGLAQGFNRMSERLQAADAERTIMLAGVSHDLRSPLSKLRLGLEIVGERIEPEIRTGMERNIEAMDAIIGQFLDFARPDADEPAIVTDLNALLAEAVEGLATDAGFELDLAPVPSLPLRRRAMARLVDNLVENARRYGRPPIAIRSGCSGATAWFVVADHGPGIAEADLDRIRRPFVRGDAARSGSPGAGLGLAIAERIAARHGGAMLLASPAGGGFEVRIELPLPKAAP
jgi:two-component system, OmpR family, osmolarity sensor histidine kinase EnvZ